jgi:hypothetical protein
MEFTNTTENENISGLGPGTQLMMTGAEATSTIADMFWAKMEPTMMPEKEWYQNLSGFVDGEIEAIEDIDDTSTVPFAQDEQWEIWKGSFHLVLDKLEVDEEEWEEHEDEVDWDAFDSIMEHYMHKMIDDMEGGEEGGEGDGGIGGDGIGGGVVRLEPDINGIVRIGGHKLKLL